MEETLGKRIVARRKGLGMTQDQLAERLGVTAQAVSKWENDQSCPDITILLKLAGIFGITVDALLGCEPPQEVTVYESEIVTEEKEDDTQENEGIHIQNGSWEFHWDSGRKSSLGLALLVLLVGGLLLVGEVFGYDFSFWGLLWPSALLIYGLLGLLPRFPFSRICSVLLGGYFLAEELDLLPVNLSGKLVFPIILVVLGLSLLADALRKPRKPRFSIHHNGKHQHKNDCHVDGEHFTADLSFGENTLPVPLPRLAGGDANVSFGELVVDLTACEEIAENCHITANCAFGELVLRVPRRYRVDAVSSTAFASFEIKGTPDPEPAGVITLEASASFGEITVHYI